jgi:RimJ/RimL family protein N-acetyltransferase
MQHTIITSRLILNMLSLEDHDFVLRLVNSEGWIEFIGDRNVHTKEDAIAYINRIISTQNLFYWVVRIKEENTSIGIISFLKRAYLEHFDIGFAFLPEFTNNGFAYEASKEVLSVVNKMTEYSSVLATTIPQNVNSIKLLNKLGFHFEKQMEVENKNLHIYRNSDAALSTGDPDKISD